MDNSLATSKQTPKKSTQIRVKSLITGMCSVYIIEMGPQKVGATIPVPMPQKHLGFNVPLKPC